MLHWSVWLIAVLVLLSVRVVICLPYFNKKTSGLSNGNKKSKITFIVFGSGKFFSLKQLTNDNNLITRFILL